MVAGLNRDQLCIFAAAFLRALGIGMAGVLLAIYLSALDWGIGRIGVLIGLGFAGAACGTLLVSFLADRAGRRRTLAFFALLNALGAASLAVFRNPTLLLLAAFFGMINGMGRARGASYALEQAVLPETTSPQRRTLILAYYGLVLDGSGGLGSLLAGLPHLLRQRWGWQLIPSYQVAWLLAAALSLLSIGFYASLSSQVEVRSPQSEPIRITPQTKRTIGKLAGLMAMDAFGGGLLPSALLSYWFFRRFGVREEWIAPLFLAASVANGVSQPVAAWLARHLGLLNTTVFTHIPSSLFLFAVPFAPDFGWAAVFFLARETLVEMDVPTRQSYVLAVVRREERSFASGITMFTRNVARVFGTTVAGYAMSGLALSSPLFLGGGIKIAYDLLLYASLRRLRPPEELPDGERSLAKQPER